MSTSAPALSLTRLQQRWLVELQLPAAFITPYVQASTASATSAPKTAATELQQLKALATSTKAGPPSAVPTAPTVVSKSAPHSAQLAHMDLAQLEHYARQCHRCDLHEQRQQLVWAMGQAQQPRWMVISTAPSSNEELAGLPMQGKRGELFRNQLHSIGLDVQSTMYFTQLLKCHSSQPAQSSYIAACQALLWRQLELVQPQHLLLLGAEPARLFFGAQAQLNTLRGQVQIWQSPQGVSIPTVISEDPSHLLLHPQRKAKAWADMLLIAHLDQKAALANR